VPQDGSVVVHSCRVFYDALVSRPAGRAHGFNASRRDRCRIFAGGLRVSVDRLWNFRNPGESHHHPETLALLLLKARTSQ
jgi:hypothetical protein